MNILDFKANFSLLGLILFNNASPDEVYKFISFVVVVGYQVHRWYKFHQDSKTNKTNQDEKSN